MAKEGDAFRISRNDAEFEWDEVKSNANLTSTASLSTAPARFFTGHFLRGSNRNSEERWTAIGKFMIESCR